MDTNGKLVRDRIPEIIEESGRIARTRQLEPAERLPALLAKLQEETAELRSAGTVPQRIEEIADVLEVLKAIAADLDTPWIEIETVAGAKRAERGGFERGFWMELGI